MDESQAGHICALQRVRGPVLSQSVSASVKHDKGKRSLSECISDGGRTCYISVQPRCDLQQVD